MRVSSDTLGFSSRFNFFDLDKVRGEGKRMKPSFLSCYNLVNLKFQSAEGKMIQIGCM